MDSKEQNVWIEKSIVHGRPDRKVGERALGKVLWSPQRSKGESDIYKNMRLVMPGDVILHLIDNKKFVGVSIVKEKVIETDGLVGTSWTGPAYLIKLHNYVDLTPEIDRSLLLNDENKVVLLKVAEKSEVFYNKKLNLREGAYLTPCPLQLFNLINNVYKRLSSEFLPHQLSSNNRTMDSEINIPFDLESLFSDFSDANLRIQPILVTRFVAALMTKPFVILTGLSGSGKTKLAQAFASWICESKNQYQLVPVGADWTNREPLLGYPNALKPGEYVQPDNGVLSLIIEASKDKNKSKPYFLILDEMNLSHVERYFADFLSTMESSDDIPLHPAHGWKDDVPSKISLPKNLFMIGTVNIDETTYMFSPKVLDRASVIEFRVTEDDMRVFLETTTEIKLQNLLAEGANMASSFISIAQNKSLITKEQEIIQGALLAFFSELKKVGAEFGFRSASEIIRFSSVINVIKPSWKSNEIIDVSVLQKLLPKVHGSRRKLEPVLRTLGGLCLQPGQNIEEYLSPKNKLEFTDTKKVRYPISLEKILRMYHGLIDNGFTSYAEA